MPEQSNGDIRKIIGGGDKPNDDGLKCDDELIEQAISRKLQGEKLRDSGETARGNEMIEKADKILMRCRHM